MNLFQSPLFPHVREARHVRRLNRFVTECELDGQVVTCHLPNPGRLWELLLPGRTMLLVENRPSPIRTTSYTAVAVIRDGVPVLLHTQMTNTVVRFLLEKGRLPGLEEARIIRGEAPFGHSRFDFLLQRGEERIILEVKSCTLFGKTMAMFPDAVTDRGRKHLLELAEWSRQGFSCGVVFVVSSPWARSFLPDYHTDFNFARTLLETKSTIFAKAVGIRWRDDLSLDENIRDIPLSWPLLEKEAQDRGCYLLVLHLPEDRNLAVGSLGQVFFPQGYYIYVGSAKKNLARRLERHNRRHKTFFWHIDYLRDAAATCLALPVRTGDDLEHDLARAVDKIAGWSVPRFGSSDCHCASHLFGMADNPLQNPAFIDMLLYVRMDRLTTI